MMTIIGNKNNLLLFHHGRFQIERFQTLDAENKTGMHVTMTTENRTLKITQNIFLEIMINMLFMLTLKTRS